MTRRTLGIASLALAAALFIGACSGHSKPVSAAQPAVTTSAPAASTAPASTPATTKAPAKPAITPALYSDGMTITAKILGYQPISEVASGGNRKTDVDVVVRITITAGSKPVDLIPTAQLQYGRDGQIADAVIDSAPYAKLSTNAMSNAPATLRPHQSVTDRFGFAVPRGQLTNLTLSVSPDMTRDAAPFTHSGSVSAL